VSWTVHPSAASRHLLLRASAGERLPEALTDKLRDEVVTCGWLRASGVLHDVELRAFDAELGTLGRARRIAGPVQVLSLESSIALSDGEPSFTLRALLARETDRGLETLAGEIVSARTVALEVLVTALDDISIGRELDPAAGVWLLGAGASSGSPRAVPVPAPHAATAPRAWSSALHASERAEPEPARTPPTPPTAAASAPSLTGAMPLPQRPVRPALDLDALAPEAGDFVDHFAFGRGEVLKSDGDRLHLRVGKDGRIREIALEMLRVSRLEDSPDGKRQFRLERRI
jgi:predicted DNA-binding protein with PD1-like motif